MKEPHLILKGFDTLVQERKPAALATVVRVIGSAYRRPGAKMLVAADGRTWGGVSGGCLEKDVIRRARNLIDTDRTALVRYDTTDEAGEFLTGCHGVIDIFIQPVSENNPGPIATIRQTIIERRPVELVTEAFSELLLPPQSLVIFGGGPDTVPLVDMAKLLGWHVTVIRSAGMGPSFNADVLAISTTENPLGEIDIEPDAAVVVMTHNYLRDEILLPLLASRPLKYLGVLGPRRRTEALLNRIPGAIERVYAPIGLDIGAQTPETIALSILAEIQAVLAGRPGPSIRDRDGPIYRRDQPAYNNPPCPTSA